MHVRYRILTFILVVTVALVLFFRGSPTPESMDELGEEASVDDATATMSVDYARELPAGAVSAAANEEASSPNAPGHAIRISSVYDVVFDTNDKSSPLSQVHAEFKNQNRDESWASAMEAGIRGSIKPAAGENKITVESVECRSTICGVAGSMPDVMEQPLPDPREILVGNFGVGWWQGDFSMAVRQHAYEEEEITRFLIVIANRGVMEKWSMPDQ